MGKTKKPFVLRLLIITNDRLRKKRETTFLGLLFFFLFIPDGKKKSKACKKVKISLGMRLRESMFTDNKLTIHNNVRAEDIG